MVAGVMLPFFETSKVKQFFLMLADNFSDGEIIFDARSKMNDDFRSRAINFRRNNGMQ